jgi:hypothetical protein
MNGQQCNYVFFIFRDYIKSSHSSFTAYSPLWKAQNFEETKKQLDGAGIVIDHDLNVSSQFV